VDTLKIDNIIVKSFSGQASPEESSYLETWLELSETNRKYHGHILQVLETLKNEKDDQFEVPDIDSEWERLKTSIHVKQKRKNLVFLRVAAIFVVILGTSFLFMYNSRQVKPEDKQFAVSKQQEKDTNTQTNIPAADTTKAKPAKLQREEYTTLADSRELALTDNSKLILDPNSSFSFKNQKNARKAFLAGSAVFNVSHIDNKDFLLATDKLEVRVVGTIFEIKESSGKKKIDIFVEEGQIEVFSKKDKTNKQIISAGECYVYNVKQDKFHQKNTNRIKLKFSGLKTKFKDFFEKK
jgi:ferric-dicitrate binding protein FerR (iron transport regulator)